MNANIVVLPVKFDRAYSPVFIRQDIANIFFQSEPADIIYLDFRRVEYIDSAALRALHICKKYAALEGIEIVFINVPEPIQQIVGSAVLGN